jgi:hypothetical protein
VYICRKYRFTAGVHGIFLYSFALTMVYSNFSASALVKNFGITFRAEHLFPSVAELAPSPWLLETLRKGRKLGFGNEKSRSERLVTPLLLELGEINHHSFSVYSGVNVDVDESLGLNGECDFVFSFSRIQDFITAPIFCITEAKQQDLERGTIQCAAQLIGAKRFNENEGHPVETLYGCSTTGIEWRFVKYDQNTIIIDEERYLISDLARLLGVLQSVIDESQKNIFHKN